MRGEAGKLNRFCLLAFTCSRQLGSGDLLCTSKPSVSGAPKFATPNERCWRKRNMDQKLSVAAGNIWWEVCISVLSPKSLFKKAELTDVQVRMQRMKCKSKGIMLVWGMGCTEFFKTKGDHVDRSGFINPTR